MTGKEPVLLPTTPNQGVRDLTVRMEKTYTEVYMCKNQHDGRWSSSYLSQN